MRLFEDYPFAQSELSAFHSMKKDGNMSTRYGDISSVFERRSRFFHQNISDNSRIIHIRANHKAVIRAIPNDIAEEIIECDGVISCNPQMYFSIAFGDCLPLVFSMIQANISSLMHTVAIRVLTNDFTRLLQNHSFRNIDRTHLIYRFSSGHALKHIHLSLMI